MSVAIFDIHQHYGALIGVPGSGGWVTTPQDDCANRTQFLDSFGIAQAALMPGHSYSAPRGFADVRAINDGLHAYAGLAPERFRRCSARSTRAMAKPIWPRSSGWPLSAFAASHGTTACRDCRWTTR